MKKGRHRRFEEARALKRSTEPRIEPCPECGAVPGDEHASWCLYEEAEDDGDGDEERRDQPIDQPIDQPVDQPVVNQGGASGDEPKP